VLSSDGRNVVNCGLGTNMGHVAVDHFVTILEEYEEYCVRLAGVQTENRSRHAMKTKRRN
jgi:hypothetical protein